MKFATGTLLMLLLAGGLIAQETTTAETTAAETTSTSSSTETAPDVVAKSGPNALYETRTELGQLIRQSPDELARLLAMEPRLLANDAFLADYPHLQEFVARHPEVRVQPSFYLAEFRHLTRRETPLDEILEPLTILSTMTLIAFALSWLVRTVIEQRRWSRLSRTQSEVHTKILDRFGTSAELLDYMKTPAGSKFLESAPIPLHADGAPQNAPMTRVLWSIQIGVVVAAGAVGMLLVSLRYPGESGQGLFALGAIALCVGLGFIVSAAVTIFLSRRLGLWSPAAVADETAGVR